jgi:hypothetical protein
MVTLLYRPGDHDEATAYQGLPARPDPRHSAALPPLRVLPRGHGQVLLRGERIHEVPCTFFARNVRGREKIGWRDFITAVTTLLKCRVGLM